MIQSDDTIIRQEAIDKLDPLFESLAIDKIKALPTAQPEIIRCKDCKYQDEGYRRVSVKWLPCMDVRVPNMWYCGSAERRTDG